MAIEEVQAFKTSDGKVFANRLNAATEDARPQVEAVVGNNLNGPQIQFLLDNAALLFRALRDLAVEQQRAAIGASTPPPPPISSSVEYNVTLARAERCS